MKAQLKSVDPYYVLLAARKVANFAEDSGVDINSGAGRVRYDHLGAVLADSVLQAGLNYSSVVRPRINRILSEFPDATTSAVLIHIVRAGQTSDFLNWQHHIKASRFERLVETICGSGIDDVFGLRRRLVENDFCLHLRKLNGIGPKTVDYMACLVGVETIAVDRHVQNFAKRVGIENMDYDYLKQVFCFAADFLSVSRRDFDSWIWKHETHTEKTQLTLAI